MISKFKVGQAVFFERYNRSSGGRKGIVPVIISKVGRVWVYFSNRENAWKQDRFSIADMRVDGGKYYSPGCIWLSEAYYNESLKKDNLMGKLNALITALAVSRCLGVPSKPWKK